MSTSDVKLRLARILDADRSDYVLSKVYDRFMCIVIVLSIVPLMFSDSNTLLNIISWSSLGIFFIDFILRWFTSSVDQYKIGRPWWRRYPFTVMGVIDITSLLPAVYLLNTSLRGFRFFRLARLAAFFKYSRYSDADDMLIKVLKKNKKVLKHLFGFVFVYIFVSALLIYNIEPLENTITGQHNFSSFFDAIYWSIVTLTTVGYGDIYPVTIIGKAISVSLMICGVGLIATISSIITAGLVEEINNKNKK